MSEILKNEPIALPYYVIDAWLDRALRGLAEVPQWPLSSGRAVLSSGSVRYAILDRKKTALGWLDVTAVSDTATLFEASVSLSLPQRGQELAAGVLETIFSQFMGVFKKGAVQAIQIESMLGPLRDLAIPESYQEGTTAKRGPKPDKVNEWARQEATSGKTIDEILPEYARRRRLKLVEARELLRKALKRK